VHRGLKRLGKFVSSVGANYKTQAQRDAEAAEQQAVAIRLEALRMAVTLGGSAADVRTAAESFADFVVNGLAQPAPAVPPPSE
jgi:hypothetical protein